MRTSSPWTASRSSRGRKPPDGLHPALARRIARRQAYAALLVAAAFAHFLAGLADSPGLVSAAGMAVFVLAVLAATIRSPRTPVTAGVAAAAALAILLELRAAPATAGPTAGVLLLAAGFLAEADRAVRLCHGLLDEGRTGRLGSRLSLVACLSAGAGLSLLARGAVAGLAADPGTTAAFALAAVGGDTPVHVGLLLLFCSTVAGLGFAALEEARERRALGALRRIRKEEKGIGEMARMEGYVDGPVAAAADAAAGRPDGAARLAVLDALAAESARVMSAAITALPLFGFVGTVVGLATAIGALESGGTGGAAAIARGLSGLAVKFETTLLGIGGALVCGLAAALLERASGERAAETAFLLAPREAGHGG